MARGKSVRLNFYPRGSSNEEVLDLLRSLRDGFGRALKSFEQSVEEIERQDYRRHAPSHHRDENA